MIRFENFTFQKRSRLKIFECDRTGGPVLPGPGTVGMVNKKMAEQKFPDGLAGTHALGRGPGLWWLGGPGAGLVRDPSSSAGTEKYKRSLLKNLKAILKVPFLPESLFEILDINPGLFKDPNQRSFLQFITETAFANNPQIRRF
jgi:hypothetical protein